MKDVFVDLFVKQLKECGDIDNLIIKGHLITEYALNLYIEKKSVEVPDNLDRWTYANKVEICQILGLFQNRSNLKIELKKLNKLRNSIAHNLEYDPSLLEDFLNFFERVDVSSSEYLTEIRKVTKDSILIIEKGSISVLEAPELLANQDPISRFGLIRLKFMSIVTFICGIIIGVRDSKSE